MHLFVSGPRFLGVRPGIVLGKRDLAVLAPPSGPGGWFDRQLRRTDIGPPWLRWLFKLNVMAWALCLYGGLAAVTFLGVMFIADLVHRLP